MPTYEYICSACEHEFETFHGMSADPLKDCPACAEPSLKRKIGLGGGIIFKGGGFYETDFKDRKGSKSVGGESGDSKSGDGKSGSSESVGSKPGSGEPAKAKVAD
ncbi:MAG: zinc ribbon domain-containing protein [Opitutales bacterium]|nr:zinc ribbon domain-containing protein [Opitutales bacterium]